MGEKRSWLPVVKEACGYQAREVGDHLSIACSFLAHSTVSAASLTFCFLTESGHCPSLMSVNVISEAGHQRTRVLSSQDLQGPNVWQFL